MTDVYLEQGRTWTFACALDWPGWARRGRGDEAALEELASYAERYASVVAGVAPGVVPGVGAGVGPGVARGVAPGVAPDFAPGELHVVGTLRGTGTTDFGAPDARGPWDDEPQDERSRARLADLLVACWTAFDRVAAASPAELRKGPRGGGRDRDQIAAHVQEAERSYGRTLGARVPPRTPWAEQRAAVETAIRTGEPGGSWPLRYAVRRFAWHVLDHAWEIEDKRPAGAAGR